jgi:hypothetical protein
MLNGVNTSLVALVVALAIALVTVALAPPPPITYEQAAHSVYCAQTKGCETHKAKSLWIPEDATGFFTLWIAAFTCVLAIGTLFLWDATKKSADAAKASAEHIPRVERTYVFLWHELKYRITPNAIPDTGDILEVQFALRNQGKTPAILRQINVDIRVMERYPTDFRQIASDMPPGLVLSADETTPFFPRRQLIPPDQWNSIRRRSQVLLFLGVVHYRDVFGEPHETGFCLEWDGRGFSPSPTEILNYHK